MFNGNHCFGLLKKQKKAEFREPCLFLFGFRIALSIQLKLNIFNRTNRYGHTTFHTNMFIKNSPYRSFYYAKLI